MLDSRLKFLQSRAEDGPAELVGLEATGRFALTTEGVRAPRVRVLVRMAEGHGADDLAELSQDMGLTVHIRAGDVVGGEIGIDRLTELDESEAVSYVEASRPTLTELDAAVPRITALNPTVLIVTGDHSTPAALRSHSWHPVPVLLAARTCRPDAETTFGERACLRGGLGQIEAKYLMPLALAHAGRLSKFGA